MADRNGYIGRAPGDSSVVIARQSFEPSGIQTDFTFSSGYTVGYIDAYFNGVRLLEANDYTATDGSTVGLTTYANSGDVVELIAYKAFNVGNVTDAAGNFTVGNDLTVSGNLTVTGDTTLAAGSSVAFARTSFGVSGLTTGSNITANNITGVAATATGIVKITDTTESASTSDGALIISGGVGIAKSLNVGGNITVGGTVTYEDVTNIDSVGIVTAGGGLYVGRDGSGAGIAITATTAGHIIAATGIVTAAQFDATTSATLASAKVSDLTDNRVVIAGASGELEDDGNLTFDGTDLQVGSAITMYASAGIVSATSFFGDGSNLEGVSSSGGAVLDITACLFV